LEHILNFGDEECPGPLVKTLRKLAEARRGDVIIVVTKSKECVNAIKDSVLPLGIASLTIEHSETGFVLKLQKVADDFGELRASDFRC